jgi:TonB family protein
MPEPAIESQSGPTPKRRLVIRVKILSEAPSPQPVRRRLNWAALLILGVIAVGLSWVGIRMFNSRSQSPAPVPARSAAPVVSDESLPKPVTETTESRPAEVEQPAAPPSPINEVIPSVPQSARETIRGTIRVSVRVIVDPEGKVLAATADDGGPSRYFERLAIEAAKNWTFTPAPSQEQRVMLVRFNFTRAGTTARASSL